MHASQLKIPCCFAYTVYMIYLKKNDNNDNKNIDDNNKIKQVQGIMRLALFCTIFDTDT